MRDYFRKICLNRATRLRLDQDKGNPQENRHHAAPARHDAFRAGIDNRDDRRAESAGYDQLAGGEQKNEAAAETPRHDAGVSLSSAGAVGSRRRRPSNPVVASYAKNGRNMTAASPRDTRPSNGKAPRVLRSSAAARVPAPRSRCCRRSCCRAPTRGSGERRSDRNREFRRRCRERRQGRPDDAGGRSVSCHEDDIRVNASPSGRNMRFPTPVECSIR